MTVQQFKVFCKCAHIYRKYGGYICFLYFTLLDKQPLHNNNIYHYTHRSTHQYYTFILYSAIMSSEQPNSALEAEEVSFSVTNEGKTFVSAVCFCFLPHLMNLGRISEPQEFKNKNKLKGFIPAGTNRLDAESLPLFGGI